MCPELALPVETKTGCTVWMLRGTTWGRHRLAREAVIDALALWHLFVSLVLQQWRGGVQEEVEAAYERLHERSVQLVLEEEEEESENGNWAVEFGAGIEGVREIDPADISEDEEEPSQRGTPTGSVTSGDLQQWSEDEATEAVESSETGSSCEELDRVEVVTVPARGSPAQASSDFRRVYRIVGGPPDRPVYDLRQTNQWYSYVDDIARLHRAGLVEEVPEAEAPGR